MNRCTFMGVMLSGLVCFSAGAPAACSNANANAKAQEFAALMRRKMATHPDEMGDLAAAFGDMMAATNGNVTDETCAKLDDMLRRAARL